MTTQETAALLLSDTANNDLAYWKVDIQHFHDGITIRPLDSFWNLVNIHWNTKAGTWDVYESIPDMMKGFDSYDEKLFAAGCTHFQAINQAKEILMQFGYTAPQSVIEPSEGVMLRPNYN
jgi:hypothetical protein